MKRTAPIAKGVAGLIKTKDKQSSTSEKTKHTLSFFIFKSRWSYKEKSPPVQSEKLSDQQSRIEGYLSLRGGFRNLWRSQLVHQSVEGVAVLKATLVACWIPLCWKKENIEGWCLSRTSIIRIVLSNWVHITSLKLLEHATEKRARKRWWRRGEEI